MRNGPRRSLARGSEAMTHTGESSGRITDSVDVAPGVADAGGELSHATHVVAWDVPPAIVVGERFRMKVGIRCSSECQLADRAFEVLDHEGTVVATSSVSGEIWPGTTALSVAEVELEAPAEDGLYTWRVRVPASDLDLPHTEATVPWASESSAVPNVW